MNLELVSGDDAILKTPCEDFNFQEPQLDQYDFAQALVKFMYDNNGLGLSANQVGHSLRIFAMRGSPQNFVCINPKVVWTSEEEILLDEGCLSFPGLIVKIKRPKSIRVRFNAPNGEVMTNKFTGMTARCFLHELDHLNGIIFYNKANLFHREKAFKQWKNWKQGKGLKSLLKSNINEIDAYFEEEEFLAEIERKRIRRA